MEFSVRRHGVAGFVLAGGRSSRMGSDKALIELAGKPLIEYAVTKLSRTCGSVRILSSNPALAEYAPLVEDMHPGCGPLGGIEAALITTTVDWNLFLAVDIPFVPVPLLRALRSIASEVSEILPRICLFVDGGGPQPGLCLIHRDALSYVSAAIAEGDYKLMRVFERIGREVPRGLRLVTPFAGESGAIGERPMEHVRPAQQGARSLWFANLNTRDDLSRAEAHLDALDM